MAAQIIGLNQMEAFPCAFNLKCPPPTRHHLQHMKHNLSTDNPTGKYYKIEETRNKNLLTWVEHLIEPLESLAKEINAEVLAATKNDNIPSMANRVFILYREGNDIDAEEYLNTLEALKQRPDFEDLMIEAKAEQAYYYSRMGAFDMSVKLFQEVVTKKPLNLLWKYGLGLMYRRMTNINVCYSVTTEYNVSELISLATGCLLDVTNSDEPQLRGLAYTQLIVMLNTYSTTEHVHCFQGLDGNELCEKALEVASDNPTVLCHCGGYFMNSDIDRAMALIEKSLSCRKNTMAFHYLGMCYEKKAKNAARDSLSANDKQLRQYNIDKTTSWRMSKIKIFNLARTAGNKIYLESQDQHKFVKVYLRKSSTQLDQNCSFVERSRASYEEAIKLSKKRNIPSILSLGKLYKRSNRFKAALQQFRQIMNLEQTKMTYLVTLITAYEEAGICLLELSQIYPEKSQKYYVQGKEYLTKAISLAADLASMKSGPKQCETFVRKSFEILKDDIDRMDDCEDKDKEYIRLLKLVNDYRGIVAAIDEMLESGTKFKDPEMALCAVNSYLRIGEYENALTFVNMIALAWGSDLKETKYNASERTQIKDYKATFTKVFLFVAWQRLQKMSADAKRMFQKLFATKYGECSEIRSVYTMEVNATKADILIVNDTFQDCEEGFGQSTNMAKQLQNLFDHVCGFKTFRNLEENNEFNCNGIVALFQEMKSYPIVFLVLTEEERDPLFDHMLQTLPEIRDHKNNPINVFIIQSSERVIIPDMLLRYKQRRFTLPQDDPILSIKEADECLDVTNTCVADKELSSCLFGTNSSDSDQRPTVCSDLTSNKHLRHNEGLDVKNTIDLSQIHTAGLDVTNSSKTEQKLTEYLDRTNSNDIDTRSREYLGFANSSDIHQRHTEFLDEKRPIEYLDITRNIDQRTTKCLDLTSDPNERQTACLNVTNSSVAHKKPNAILDVTNLSDIQQIPTACLAVPKIRYINERPTAGLDVTNSSATDQERRPQFHQNDVIVEHILSLVCLMLNLDFNQLKDEYINLKT